MKNFIWSVVKFILGTINTFLCVFFEAYVIITLYNWFIFPITHFTLTYPLAVGGSLILSIPSRQWQIIPRDKDEQANKFGPYIFSWIVSLSFLFAGWLVHLYYCWR